jgi:splicing factor U2AF subunit
MPPIHYGASEVAPQLMMTRQSRRLYVGNITLDANDANIAKFFNAKMREMKFAIDHKDDGVVHSPDPVVSILINHDKSYAFVEFRTPEEANSAMAFDGIVFMGQVLKIRRPKDYIGPEQGPAHYVPGVINTAVPDSEHKIFVGGLPSYLNEEQVKELLLSFGELRSFNLVKDGTTGGSKGYAFCEYVDSSITDTACAGLNGLELGDRFLVVQRASVGAREGITNPAAIAGRASGAIVAAANSEMQPSRIIQLLNMVTPDDLAEDTEYNEIKADIRDECESFGTVVDVKMARPILMESGKVDVRASEAIKDLGKVFVVFNEVDAAKKAMDALAGRQFAGPSCPRFLFFRPALTLCTGRTVLVAFLDESWLKDQ